MFYKNKIDDSLNRYTSLSIEVYLFLIAVMCLPLTRAFTLSLGFPLKIYEVLFLIAIIAFVAKMNSVDVYFYKRFVLTLLMFWSIVFFSSMMTIIVGSPVSTIAYRGGPVIDMITRLIYLLFNICVFILSYHISLLNRRLVYYYWLIGTSFVVLYMFYCLIWLNIFKEAYLLPGLERHQIGSIGSYVISRSGTFEEGNFAGLYFLLSYAIADWSEKGSLKALSVSGLILSLSSSALVGFGIYILFNKIRYSRGYMRVVFIPLISIIIALAAYFIFNINEKFEIRPGQSFVVRLNEAVTGIKMFYDHPFLGVGLGQYGYHYSFYNWKPVYDTFVTVTKRISNNVYIEVLSETGLVGFIVFFTFWSRFSKEIRKNAVHLKGSYYITIALLVVWFAYPTFNITLLWCFAGLILSERKAGYSKNIIQNKGE